MALPGKTLAIVAGLVIGGLPFLRFTYGTGPTPLSWYLAAVVLGGLGLVGVFPTARRSATVGLCLAPFLAVCVQTILEIMRDPGCCNLWPIGVVGSLVFGAIPAIAGAGLGTLLARIRLPRPVSVVPLAASALIAVSLPELERAQHHRQAARVPALLRQIHRAEMVYSARQPDTSFTCDGRRLSGVEELRWVRVRGESVNNLATLEPYSVVLECPSGARPQRFRVRACPGDVRVRDVPCFYIDQTGQLTTSPRR